MNIYFIFSDIINQVITLIFKMFDPFIGLSCVSGLLPPLIQIRLLCRPEPELQIWIGSSPENI